VPTRNLKNPPKSKILPLHRFLPLINTPQWSGSLPYSSVTLTTFEKHYRRYISEKWETASLFTFDMGEEEKYCILLINKDIFNILIKLFLELNFCREVQEEGMPCRKNSS